MSPKKFRTRKRAVGNKALRQRMNNLKKNKLKSISNSTVSTDIQQTEETVRSQLNIISVTEDSNDKLLDTFSGNENTISNCNISLPLSQSEPISSSTPTNTSVYHQPLSEVDIISENSSCKNNESNFLCGRRIVNISYVFEQAQVRHNGLTNCYFVIYTNNWINIEKIYYDSTFWNSNMADKLKMFYMECMLPEIVQPLYPIRMNKSDIREPERISNSIIAHDQKKNTNSNTLV